MVIFFSFKKYSIQDIKPEAFFLIVLAGDKTNTIKKHTQLTTCGSGHIEKGRWKKQLFSQILCQDNLQFLYG